MPKLGSAAVAAAMPRLNADTWAALIELAPTLVGGHSAATVLTDLESALDGGASWISGHEDRNARSSLVSTNVVVYLAILVLMLA